MSAAPDQKRRGLGRGLSALLGESSAAAADTSARTSKGQKTLPIEALAPGTFQPRRAFDKVALEELAQSIRDKGILQPILARPLPEAADKFEIVAGERRWRAAQIAGLHDVPVIIKDFSDKEALEAALVENLQRRDLNPIEEAIGYRRLMADFSHTQELLAQTLGKSRSHVANTLRLLALPDSVKSLLEEGALSAGHARALLASADPEALARRVLAEGLSVRDTETLSQAGPKRAGKPAAKSTPGIIDADRAALERDLQSSLGLKVTLKAKGSGGDLILHYGTLDQLDDLLRRLSRA